LFLFFPPFSFQTSNKQQQHRKEVMSSPPETPAAPEKKGQAKREVDDLNKVADDNGTAGGKEIDTASVQKLTTLLAIEKKEDQAAQQQR